MKIVHPLPDGGIAVTHPAPDCTLTLEEIACSVVPEGVPFIFVEPEEIPADRTFRDAWTADFSEPDGFGE